MELPPEVDTTPAMIAAIVARYGLGTRSATRLAHAGTSHTVYLLDDAFVLRVPREHPAWAGSVGHEARVVPAARAAGVRTPVLVVADETREILPVPFTVFERVHGIALSAVDRAPETLPELWRCVGQDLAGLHTRIPADGPLADLPRDAADLDPRPWVAELQAARMLPPGTAAYLQTWLDRLAPLALLASPRHLCHGDVNLGNILVDPATYAYQALIDWSGATWGDGAYDLAVVSLRAAPWLVEGYRGTGLVAADSTLEARILWQHLRLALYGMRRAQGRDVAWVEQRLARLFDGMRLFLASPLAQWVARLGPAELP